MDAPQGPGNRGGTGRGSPEGTWSRPGPHGDTGCPGACSRSCSRSDRTLAAISRPASVAGCDPLAC